MRGKQYRPQPPGHEGPRGGKRRGAARSSRKEGETEHKAQRYSVGHQTDVANEPWHHRARPLVFLSQVMYKLQTFHPVLLACIHTYLATRSRSRSTPASIPGHKVQIHTRSDQPLSVGDLHSRQVLQRQHAGRGVLPVHRAVQRDGDNGVT